MDIQEAFDAGFEAVKRYVDDVSALFDRRVSDLGHTISREAELREAKFAARMAELDVRLAAVSEVERRLADRLSTLKDGEPGRDGVDGQDGKSLTIDDIEPVLRDLVASLPLPKDGIDGKDGASISVEDVAPMIEARIAEAVSAIPVPKDGIDGKDGASISVEDVAPLIEARIAEAVSAIPVPRDGVDGKDGASISVEDVAPLIEARIAEAVSAIPVPKDGIDGKDGRDGKDGERGERGFGLDDFDTALTDDGQTLLLSFTRGDTTETHEIPLPVGPAGRDGLDGKDGKDGDPGPVGPVGSLPPVKSWEDGVYYKGDVVAFDGAAYQASKDTGKAPPHGDWICIVARGADGRDGRSFTVCGTYAENSDYAALDVVALNGAAFVAKHDGPGPCPGEGWQMIAMQGKPGKPGPKGDPGMGMRGLPGPAIRGMEIDGSGLLTLVNGDGSEIQCDLYPVLARIGG